MTTSTIRLSSIYEDGFAVDQLIGALDLNDPEFNAKLRWVLRAFALHSTVIHVDVIDLNTSPAHKDRTNVHGFANALSIARQQIAKNSEGRDHDIRLDFEMEVDMEGNALIWTSPGKHGMGIMILLKPVFPDPSI